LIEHVRRILRSEFASGIVDFPMKRSVVDVEGGFETAQRFAEQSMVLLPDRRSLMRQ
jgi:beta-glucosidase